ncbi:RNA-directed DNA polymerase [Lacticaseibacillus paracasei]|uniref:Uncharacterized protein n=1 Tax=Lacticaseibacillus paracasei NRIC 0644 TaxID=1435038 RepID=A0A0C9PSM5_LACPA|nr:RNA-directed DNA polymerase [Lacticaseibacillus paracasei]GAN37931.1 hypothetical protein LC0644_2520 [Lacticaseibacillus paracasei NRIC 0644]GEK40594.1 hypothetical protein LCA02_22840 [Lacticaseibacillus casei]
MLFWLRAVLIRRKYEIREIKTIRTTRAKEHIMMPMENVMRGLFNEYAVAPVVTETDCR